MQVCRVSDQGRTAEQTSSVQHLLEHAGKYTVQHELHEMSAPQGSSVMAMAVAPHLELRPRRRLQ